MREQVNIDHERSRAPEPWLPGNLQRVLASEPYEAEDDLYGLGEGHFYGPTGECRLAFYPDFQTVEYEDPQTYLVIKKPSRLTLMKGAVWMDVAGDTQSSFFAFDQNGGVEIIVKPRPLDPHTAEVMRELEEADRLSGGRSLTPYEIESQGTQTAPATEPITEPPVSDLVAPWEVAGSSPGSAEYPIRQADSQTGIGNEASASSPESERKKQRIDINGRVGRLPTFKTTQRGKRMGRFPVAEHQKDEAGEETTTWYTVAVFNALAERSSNRSRPARSRRAMRCAWSGIRKSRWFPTARAGSKSAR